MIGLKLSYRCWFALLVLGTTLFACGDDSNKLPKARLIDGKAATDDIDLGAEQLRKREMQKIKMYNPATQTWIEEEVLPDAGPASLISALLSSANPSAAGVSCAPTAECVGTTPTSCTGGACTCVQALCAATGALCLAHSMVDILGLTSEPFVVRSNGFQVPAQSAATNSVLAREAAFWTVKALVASGSAMLFAARGDTAMNSCLAGTVPNQSRSYAAGHSASFLEAYHLYGEVVKRSVEESLAVADAELSSTPSLQTAIARAIAASELSRSAASHALVGGQSGLFGQASKGFCASADLTPEARAALGVFRTAAIAPDDVLNSNVTIDQLLGGTLTNGSVKQRLAQYWNYSGLLSASTADQVAAYFGLRKNDFVEARRRLVEEIVAFSRNTTAELPARQLVTGTSTFKVFTATAREPTPIDPSYYGAIARTWIVPLHAPFQYPPTSIFSRFDLNLAQTIDGSLTQAAEIVALSTTTTVPNASVRNDMLTPLALLLGEGERQRLGRFYVFLSSSFGNPANITVTVEAIGFSPTESLRLVKGEDGLRCATEGSIEGAPCSLGALTLVQLTGTLTSIFPGIPRAATGTASVPRSTFPTVPGVFSPTAGVRAYLVRNKPGRSGNAGDFESLGGTLIGGSPGFAGNQTGETRNVTVMPALDRRVAEVLEPSRRWCTRSKVSCAGEAFDARLPLEDELSDDNDGVESSWKHYLELAKQSAAEADALAQDVINFGLEADLRGEQALAELQDICGTNVDSSVVLKGLSGGGSNLSQIRTDTACTVDGNCTGIGADYRCIAQRCTRDPVSLVAQTTSNADLNRLSECIGSDSVQDFVTPGKRKLCIWYEGSDKNRVCTYPLGGNNETQRPPCPRPLDNEASTDPNIACSGMTLPPGTFTKAIVSTSLGYFDNSQINATPTFGNNDWCNQFRAQRTTPGSQVMGNITGSNIYHPDNLRELGARIGWEARLGGYSAITFDGRPKFQTGDPWGGPATTGWPCAAAMVTPCTGTDNFVCSTVQCGTNTAARAEFNDRMAKAVIAIRATTQDRTTKPFDRLKGVRIPYRGSQIAFGSSTPAIRNLPNGTPVKIYTTTSSEERDAHERYTCDAAGQVAWQSPVAEGSLSFTTTNLTDNNSGNPYTFAIGDAAAVLNHDIDPLGFWAGMSNSAKYALNPNAAAVGADTGTVWGYFHGVLNGTRTPGNVGRVLNQPLPWTRERLDLVFNTVHDDWEAVFDNTPAFRSPNIMLDFTYSRRSLLDGMELLCELNRSNLANVDINQPPQVNGIEDLERVKVFLDKVSTEMLRRAGMMVFANLPTRAVDALQNESSIGSYPSVGGQYGERLAHLRAALVELSQVTPLLANEFKLLGLDLDNLRITLQRNNIANQITSVKFLSEVANQMAACASSTSADPTKFIGMFATCGNAFAQIQFAQTIQELTLQDNELARQLALNDFFERFSTRATALSGYAKRALEASETVNASLAGLETLRTQARRALSRALFLDSDQAGQQFAVNTVMRRHFNMARARYETARKNAVRMAFLAKRAIELRLGVRLTDLHDDLPLVPAPATWEATVCTSTGVDYAALRDANDTSPSNADDLAKFADPFIGSYVQKLENLVESYRLVNNFHEGTDTAVISLRDDVQNVRATCDTAVGNLLYQAGQLDRLADPETGAPGWERLNCGTQADGTPLPNCVQPFRLNTDASAGPFPDLDADLGEVRGYTVVHGPWGATTCNPSTCGQRNNSALIQRVQLRAGNYRLSWYGRASTAGTMLDSQDPRWAVHASRAGVFYNRVSENSIPATGSTWTRYYFTFVVPTEGEVVISIQRDPNLAVVPQQVQLAAIMLEDVSTAGATTNATTPKVFANTSETLERPLPTCEDTTGSVFRRERWLRNCVRLCPDGYSSRCTASGAQTYCYRETTFDVSQRGIEAGKILNQSSFARGNFNYRLETIGVNFVGSGIRDCSDSNLPSTCNSAGFVSYSIQHNGPYLVRNDMGRDFQADLFTGMIEHARGLATERYLTNPISSSDQDLIGQYLRQEFRGRPLDGNFVLRVWEEPGMNFDAITDVQLVLNYRYWTRFD